LNAVFNLAPFFIGKRQTPADGPAQFVVFFLGGWRGRAFRQIFLGGGPFAEKTTRSAGIVGESRFFSFSLFF
jgi:hypothetical protein